MNKFYIFVECPNCDHEIRKLMATTIDHDGIPVIPFDMAAQTDFDCSSCGSEWVTGDFELFKMGE